MMTDRELLELAAKAAGIDLIPYTWFKGTGWDHEGFTLAGEGPDEWNPLEDDGAALRLAVKLEIDLSFYTEREARVYAQTKHCLGFGTDGMASYQAHEYHKELYAEDPYAATRRAIVRAAAEIGKAK